MTRQQPIDVQKTIANIRELRASLRRNRSYVDHVDPNLYQELMALSEILLEHLDHPFGAKLLMQAEARRQKAPS